VAPHLDDQQALDRATRRYEWLRDREVLPTYYWGHKHSRVSSLSAVEREFYLQGEYDPQVGRDLVDTFSRHISPYKFVNLPREVTWTIRALRRPGADRRTIVRWVVAEKTLDLAYVVDKAMLKVGRRPKGTAVKRWVRDGWTEHMALGNHRPSSTPFLPEEERARAAAAAAARTATRRRRPAAAKQVADPTTETTAATA